MRSVTKREAIRLFNRYAPQSYIEYLNYKLFTIYVNCKNRSIVGIFVRKNAILRTLWAFLGLVLSILLGAAIALALSEERRHQLRQRLEVLRNVLPDGEHLKHSAQQAAARAREAGSHLGEQMQDSASRLGHRTQEMASVTRHPFTSLGAYGQARSTNSVKESSNRA